MVKHTFYKIFVYSHTRILRLFNGVTADYPAYADIACCTQVNVKFSLEQATKVQRGEQMYSSTLPSTSALDRGGRSMPRPSRFTPGKDPVPIV